MCNFFGILEAMSMSSEAVLRGFKKRLRLPQSLIRFGPYCGKHAWHIPSSIPTYFEILVDIKFSKCHVDQLVQFQVVLDIISWP